MTEEQLKKVIEDLTPDMVATLPPLYTEVSPGLFFVDCGDFKFYTGRGGIDELEKALREELNKFSQ